MVTASGASFPFSKRKRKNTLFLVSALTNFRAKFFVVRSRLEDVESIQNRLDRLRVARGQHRRTHADIIPYRVQIAREKPKKQGVSCRPKSLQDKHLRLGGRPLPLWQARLCKKTLDAPCKAHQGVSGSGWNSTCGIIYSLADKWSDYHTWPHGTSLPCYCMHPTVARSPLPGYVFCHLGEPLRA